MECQLCKHKPKISEWENGSSQCKKEGCWLFRIKNTYFEETVDSLRDNGQCASFELNKNGLTEFELFMMDKN